jgi:hypothetical protein
MAPTKVVTTPQPTVVGHGPLSVVRMVLIMEADIPLALRPAR